MNMRRVVISGTGAVTPYGNGIPAYWKGILSGHGAATPITSFDVTSLPTHFAAQVPFSDRELEEFIENKKATKTMSRAARFAAIAANEAVRQGNLDTHALDPWRFGTCVGTGGLGFFDVEYSDKLLEIFLRSVRVEDGKATFDAGQVRRNTLDMVHPLTPLKALQNILTAHIAIQFNARGVCQTVTTACTSAAQAVGEAYRIVRTGAADVVITGGSDSMVNPNGVVAFSAIGVISKNNDEYRTASRPFDNRRDGFMIGEGAAMFVIETLEHCLARGAVPLAEIIGYGSTCDAYRLTDPPPDGRGCIEAMRLALRDAEIDATEVDYINAHGTGTRMNDKTETMAIHTVFGNNAVPPVSSTKSMIGHLVAAAGAVELAACVLALQHQIMPPTINYREPDPDCDLDYVPNEARKAHLETVLTNSFGFGGQNATIVIRKPPL
ncbi:MAG: beta-ketoacyl-[acyl-carrier-protein] synthase II [Ignavibacteria bacterium]|nr:MAG: beta-ketoacyl-[acyl-carrier-protein] synthase II [Ignavibacteria bacterium]